MEDSIIPDPNPTNRVIKMIHNQDGRKPITRQAEAILHNAISNMFFLPMRDDITGEAITPTKNPRNCKNNKVPPSLYPRS
ncbi:hypothetical protein D3C81_2119420 [compost metagenome]